MRHNLLSWKEKTRLRIQDKIRKILLEQKLPANELVKELLGRNKLLEDILKKKIS
jgi:hypothetical protein